jgi:hypothetical protein
MDSPILLSVVATTRNDDHGKNLQYRMQKFVDGFVEQCKRHNLNAELILVEWNPPDTTPSLAQALHYQKDKGPCSIRIVRVPKDVHLQFEYAEKIPLFQMIGKNVGIRRAKGEFVLATNIDIIFSDHVMRYIKTKLKKGHLYRVDRLDVPEMLPESQNFDDILAFCSKNVLRINAKIGTIPVQGKSRFFIAFSILRFLYSHFFLKIFRSSVKTLVTRSIPFTISLINKGLRWGLDLLFPENSFIPHTNACGDFTLLSAEEWNSLRGYPEWNKYSWHIDSVLVYQARQHGIKEVDLRRKDVIYHIEHEAGSGYAPEYAHLLFKRLNDKGIPYLSNDALDEIVFRMKKSNEKVVYNGNDWGLAALSLEEIVV